MCGVAGFLRLGDPIGADEGRARLQHMTATISHRGPDGHGHWTDGRCGLGHRRLAVIDLTESGRQPMSTPDGRFWITYNGEIYNFQEIRQDLAARGVRFQSTSDTEVILEGYRLWGDGILARLRGMFAFALWDVERQRLLLVRDRLGKKPMYWAQIGDTLVFGSELKALMAWPGFERAIDPAAIHEYFTYQYINAPRTIFKNVHKLEPATKLTIVPGAKGWRIEAPRTYWRLPAPMDRGPERYDAVALQEELVAHLKEAVRLRMISDVPLGAFLSGGVDSSAVVAIMATLSDKPVKTFSIGSPYPEYDETKYARMVAERYATDHEELILEPNAAEILAKLVWHYNEPYSDASMIPTFYVSQMARRRVTVALNGDGGDEAFIGYRRYDTVRDLARQDDPALGPQGKAKFSQRYGFTIVAMDADHKRTLYGPALRDHLATDCLDMLDPYFDEAPDFVAGANWVDTHTYLPGDLLPKVDVASMAVSLESRSPLLDHVLMEWAFGLPAAVKTPGGEAKGLFKKAMEPYLPHELMYRPKMGFGVPIDHWLRTDLKEMAYDTLLADRAHARGLVRSDAVATMLDQHVSGQTAHHTRLFCMLNLELWFRQFVDQPIERAVAAP
jgi:asparagine synthase (glutamine-hydrolysing)